MPELTITDNRTGNSVPVYVGADPIIEPVVTPPAATTPVVDPTAAAAAAPSDPAATTVAPSDPVAQAAATEPAARNDKGQFIPKARFDEVNTRRKAAEQEVAQLKASTTAATQAAANAYDFDAAETNYINLLLDGKIPEATQLRKEIRVAEQAQYTRVAAETVTTVTAQQSVSERITETANQYETDYPVFNPDSEHFSEDVVDDLKSLYSGYAQSGRFADNALAFKAALDNTLKMHGIAQVAAPAVTPSAAAATRTAQSRVQAIVSQPPLIAKAGTGGAVHGESNVRVQDLSAEQLMALPEATRRRLRGDNL